MTHLSRLDCVQALALIHLSSNAERADQAAPSLGAIGQLPDARHIGAVEQHRRRRPPARYLISVSSLNIGRYMLMITMPTMIPTPSIMIGSTIEVSDWMEASTSSS